MKPENNYKGGMLRYKCRMCGEEFQNTHVPDVSRAVSAIVYDFPNPWPNGGVLPSLIETHYHKDGFGVADLIGGVIDAEYLGEE
jgi:hypothetical protein